MIDFRMETFLCVCEYMNYTKASKKLNITQPAVSQHIKYLENEYQITIFKYIGKKMIITAQGQMLLDYAITLKHDNLYLKEKLHHTKKLKVSFGATLTIGEYLLENTLSHFLKNNNDVNLSMKINNTSSLLHDLNRGIIDFAIVEGYFNSHEYDSLIYSKEKFICVTNHKQPPMTLSELLKNTVIVREQGSGSREILVHYLNEKNHVIDDFKQIYEISNINVIKYLVKNNGGYTFIYKKAVEKELQQETLYEVNIEDFNYTHQINFIWRKNSMFKNDYKKIYEELKYGCKNSENTIE